MKKEELIQTALQWAELLAEKPPFAVGLTKSAMLHALSHPLGDVIQYEAFLQQFCRVSKDFEEGKNAFNQKRKAQFTGEPVDIPAGTIYSAKL